MGTLSSGCLPVVVARRTDGANGAPAFPLLGAGSVQETVGRIETAVERRGEGARRSVRCARTVRRPWAARRVAGLLRLNQLDIITAGSARFLAFSDTILAWTMKIQYILKIIKLRSDRVFLKII